MRRLRGENTDLIGREVYHPSFGRGEIVAIRWRGDYVRVRFKGKFYIWLPLRKLRLLRAKKEEDVVIKKRPPVRDKLKARRMIEALRYGIVPHEDIEDFTFGRDKEIAKLERGIEKFELERGFSLLVEGEYGAGKTHFLDFSYHFLLRRGFAVAKIEFDYFDVSPLKPWRIYREITKSFAYERGGFRDFLKEILPFLKKEHIFLTPLSKFGDLNEALWQWIEGERNPRVYLNREKKLWRLPVLLTHSTALNLYTYLISTYSSLATKIGLKGLVLLFDEVEVLFHFWFERRRVMKFLELLLLLPRNSKLLLNEYIDGFSLVTSRVRKCPYAYDVPTNLFIILASAPVYSKDYIKMTELVDEIIYLEPLRGDDLKDIFNAIVTLYELAYEPFKVRDREGVYRFIEMERDKGIRHFIKATVEALDLVRHYPDKFLFDLFVHG